MKQSLRNSRLLLMDFLAKLVQSNSKKIFYTSVVVFSIFRILLLNHSNFHLYLEGYDDLLQVKNSVTLANFEWLGAYTNITMAKNIGFPIFLALAQYLNLPYAFLYGLLIVLASFVFIKAIEPCIKNYKILFLIYLFVLYIPINHWGAFRIYRNALVPWFVLLVVSCLIGMFIRRQAAFNQYFLWSFGSFCFLGYFWILREDSVWLLPFIVTAITCLIVSNFFYFRKDRGQLFSRIFASVFPLLGICFITFFVSAMNYHYYGIYATNDRSQTYGAKLMTYLYKIDDGRDNRKNSDVWASKKSLQLAIKASPTLATIKKPLLANYTAWAGGKSNIKGDLVQWAVRSAMSDGSVGYYNNNPVETNNFYKKVCQELDKAFKSHQLKKKKGIFLSAQTGAFYAKDFSESIGLSFQSTFKILNYQDADPVEELFHDNFSEKEIAYFQDVLVTTIPRNTVQLINIDVSQGKAKQEFGLTSTIDSMMVKNNALIRNHQLSLKIQKGIVKIYKIISKIMIICGFLGYIVLLVRLFRNKLKVNNNTLNFFLAITGCALSGFLNIMVVVLFSRWITRDPNSIIYGYYASSSYVLYSIAMLLGCLVLYLQMKEVYVYKKRLH